MPHKSPPRPVLLNLPASGTTRTVETRAGYRYRFAFDPSSEGITFNPDNGRDLIITSDQSGTLVLRDFLVVKPAPDFVLPDGAMVSGEELVQAFCPNSDFTTGCS